VIGDDGRGGEGRKVKRMEGRRKEGKGGSCKNERVVCPVSNFRLIAVYYPAAA